MKKRILLIVLSALAVGRAGVSDATQADTWELQCMPNYETSTEICTTEFLTNYEGRDFIIYFAHTEDGSSPLVFSGPAESFAEATVEVHGKKPVSTDKCEIGLCYFKEKKSAVLLQQFIRGDTARITISSKGAKPALSKEISLFGFAAAFWKYQTQTSWIIGDNLPDDTDL